MILSATSVPPLGVTTCHVSYKIMMGKPISRCEMGVTLVFCPERSSGFACLFYDLFFHFRAHVCVCVRECNVNVCIHVCLCVCMQRAETDVEISLDHSSAFFTESGSLHLT